MRVMNMTKYIPQPDEGYSEAPLNSVTGSKVYDGLFARTATEREQMAVLMRQMNGLSLTVKTDIVISLLNELPTSAISTIVQKLHPRLYIDFIRYLPPEVCLKILEYLDPASLIKVARSCRTWYELALDRKLWQRAYIMEGWKYNSTEVQAWEQEVNAASPTGVSQTQRIQSDEDGHTNKKRAISNSLRPGNDPKFIMTGADDDWPRLKQEPVETEPETSIFGGLGGLSSEPTTISQGMGDIEVQSAASSSHARNFDKGKGRALSPSPDVRALVREGLSHSAMPKMTLSIWDSRHGMFRLNWKYLYSMRRRLESNWEMGKFVNFQFPHPDFPEEGHAECIYSLQYNPQYLVSGSRDKTLKIWDMKTRRLVRTLSKHTLSVLCLQFDSDPTEDIVVSGSSDSNVIVWKFSTGEPMQVLKDAHRESVLNVKFDHRILVTCSKDKTIKIFNRRPLGPNDMGYAMVDPVVMASIVTDYGCNLSEPPVVLPPYTMLGALEGHNAAVNAVQIHGLEVVSASGDRQIKVWDWTTRLCSRTFQGHAKGIACVQYDGRRIVSGSSDNEVKVFDRQTGVEVASLRAHSDLVRTVQAGFADLPHSIEEDAREAKKVDAIFFKAVAQGKLSHSDSRQRTGRPTGNAGSRKPEHITGFGATLPPGGGGSKYGRIVSGSYDTSIIIWRRDKEGLWKDQHHLKQEEAAIAAMGRRSEPGAQPHVALHPSVLVVAGGGDPPAVASASQDQAPSSRPSEGEPSSLPGSSQLFRVDDSVLATLTPSSIESYRQMINNAVPGGPLTLSQALASYPTILTQRDHLNTVIDREPNHVTRAQLRQVVGSAIARAQYDQIRARHQQQDQSSQQAVHNLHAGLSADSSSEATARSNNRSQPQSPAPAQHQQQHPQTHASVRYVRNADGTIPEGLAQAANHGHRPRRPDGQLVPPPAHLHQVSPTSSLASASASVSVFASACSPTPLTPLVDFTIPSHPPPTPFPAPATQHHPGHGGRSGAGAQTPAAMSFPALPVNSHLPNHSLHHNHLHLHQHRNLPISTPNRLYPAPPLRPIAPHAHSTNNNTNTARVFKLQFDARHIICCRQTSVIIGWDFCNDDSELAEACRFFEPVQ